MEQLYKEILQFFLIIFNRQVRSDVLLGVHAGSQDLKKLLDEISISF
jgi:hypothetical protein